MAYVIDDSEEQGGVTIVRGGSGPTPPTTGQLWPRGNN